MMLLNIAVVWGLGRLQPGLTEDMGPILVKVFWVCYDLAALSIVLVAAAYPPVEAEKPSDGSRESGAGSQELVSSSSVP